MPSIPFAQLCKETYAYLDPASGTTEQKRANQARSAFCVVGIDDLARVFVLYSWADRISTTDIIDKVAELQLTYTPVLFGIESAGQQTLFASVVEHEILKRGIPINIEYHKPPTLIEKPERIRAAIQPLSKSGRLFYQPHQTLLIEESRAFPTPLTFDLIDSLAGAISLVPPRRLTSRIRDASTLAGIREYLRLSGQDHLLPLYQNAPPRVSPA